VALDFFTMDDFDFAGKTVIVRVDINCPVDDKGKISESERLAAHAQTLKELSGLGARTAILAHQGRPGDADFLPLQQHADALSKLIGKKVQYVSEVIGPYAIDAIKKLEDGDLLLLENVRYLKEELQELSPAEHAKGQLVQTLSPLADIFVNDAFSAAHRSQASLVGFTQALPSCAGRVMQREVENVIKVTGNPQHPNTYVLGGAKPDDCWKLMRNALKKGTVDYVLVSGVLGNLCLAAKGVNIGQSTWDYYEKKGFSKFFPELKTVVASNAEKIIAPLDLAYEENGARKEADVSALPDGKSFLDIGAKTVEKFKEIISQSKTLYLKGPQGVFEQPLFEYGSRETLMAIANSSAFSLTGGGHTDEALKKFGIPKEKISYTSLAGGALLTYMAGEPLPALDALRENRKKGQ
jgi:phosphoglycerate kinase